MNIVRKRGLDVNEYRLMLPHVAALIAIGLGVREANPFAAAADGAARFCTSRDFAGNLCEQLWWLSVQPPPASGVTAMRDDGVILVDGKPPIWAIIQDFEG